jgi:hypothetical protein
MKEWQENGEDCIMRSFTKYYQGDKIKENDMGAMRTAYKIMDGKSEEKKPVGRRMHKWRGNIKLDIREI